MKTTILILAIFTLFSCNKKEAVPMKVQLFDNVTSIELEKKSGDLTVTSTQTIIVFKGEKIKYKLHGEGSVDFIGLTYGTVVHQATNFKPEGKFRFRE